MKKNNAAKVKKNNNEITENIKAGKQKDYGRNTYNEFNNISEEDLIKLKSAVEKKRKSYNSPQDILTVCAIFAVLALTCVVFAFIGNNPEFVTGSSSGTITPRQKEEAKQISYVVAGVIGAVSLGIICLFIVSMRKRKKKEAREFEIKELKRLQLDAAKRRVANARMSAKQEREMSEWEKRRAMRKYSLDEGIKDEDFDGSGRYSDRDIDYDMDLDIDKILSEYDKISGETDETYGFFGKIKNFFAKLFGKVKK